MKAFALAALAAIGLVTVPCVRADVLFDNLGSGFGVHDANPHHGGPYFVAGFGDDNHVSQRRYWGGPYWVECAGSNPPFETYRMSCRPAVVKIAIREHRRVRARLK